MSHLTLLLLACTDSSSSVGGETGADCPATAWYADADGDGFGAGEAATACVAPPYHVTIDGDCDDQDPGVFPGAEELCNGDDDDCDGHVDPPDLLPPITCYRDADVDGWGIDDMTFTACACPDGYALQPGDCDDDDPEAFPGAEELWYDGVDQDCLGGDDFDADGDAWPRGDDCDDGDPSIHPDAEEVCGNGIDDDCDGLPGACGIDRTWDVVDPRLEILSMNPDARALPLGTVADVDGDGQPELALGWYTRNDQGCGPGETFVDVYVTSMAATGTESAGARSLARLAAPVDCRTGSFDVSALPGADANHDLDGDGHVDMVVSVNNWIAPPRTTVPSRLYFASGPLEGDVDLGDSAYLEDQDNAFFVASRPWITSPDDDGEHTILIPNYHESSSTIIHFATVETLTGEQRLEDAPALTWTSDWVSGLADGSVADVDGDGLSDLLLVNYGHSATIRFAAVYLGPFHADRAMEDTDGELWSTDDTSAELYTNAVACPTSAGDSRLFVFTLWEDSETSEAATAGSVAWDWVDGFQDLGDSALRILGEEGVYPIVDTCMGDMDADGEPELVMGIEYVDTSGVEDASIPIVALASMPEPGAWSWQDLARGEIHAPTDRAWGKYDPTPPLVTDLDFTGDGVDDFVMGLYIQPAGHEPEETGSHRTLMFTGSRSGL
ncbi:putative metal-binding motif-containing protein [Myxococcota bacterium]|nr:putative metal-binding motif-containing protein [Myxococcota bacterium]